MLTENVDELFDPIVPHVLVELTGLVPVEGRSKRKQAHGEEEEEELLSRTRRASIDLLQRNGLSTVSARP